MTGCRPRQTAAAAVVVVMSVLLAACGGRVSRPVQVTSPLDAQLTCTHIQAEAKVNLARIDDLSAEKTMQGGNNAGLLLAGPLFLDLSSTEADEMKALRARNDVLRQLAVEKSCAVAAN